MLFSVITVLSPKRLACTVSVYEKIRALVCKPRVFCAIAGRLGPELTITTLPYSRFPEKGIAQ
jgi:hypothetical protein